MEIKIKYFGENPFKLSKIAVGDWIDLRSRLTIQAEAGDYIQIPLGVAMELPEGYEAIIAPRSSSYKKYGFIDPASIGVIDHSYCGDNDEWLLPALFLTDGFIHAGDRICQFRVQKNMETINFSERQTLNCISRGGLGTTGKK